MGAALVPNRPIYRKSEDDEEYYIFFNRQTVEKSITDVFLSMAISQNLL